MKKSELPEYTAHIITEYYKNNIQLFLNALSEKCIWIGPAKGQIVQTKKALLDIFSKEDTPLTFSMENLQIIPIPLSSTSMDVILTYRIITYYPNGESNIFQQRTELVWAEESRKNPEGKTEKDYFIRVCHVSNEYPYDSRDTIYPNHFNELEISKVCHGQDNSCELVLKGLYNSLFHLSSSTIMWMETSHGRTLIHTTDQVYESTETLTAIVEKSSDAFCRIHASYAVNPFYVSEIGRFYALMKDGTKLSIPEKKYTKTRDELNRRIQSLS